MRISVWLTNATARCLNFSDRHKRRMENGLPTAVVSVHTESSSFKRSLAEADIAIAWVFKDDWLALAPRLKWLATPAAGKDMFELHPPPGLKITYGAFHGKIMAETAAGMILSAARGIVKASRLQRTAAWPRAELEESLATVDGARIVILGFGAIGSRIARLLKPFGARITGVKRRPAAPPEWFGLDDRVIVPEGLDAVLPETDHLVIVLPKDPSTDNIIDAGRLALLPGRAYVYNLGRGNAIEEPALLAALRRGAIAGAYLDVFKEEPLPPDSPLRDCPNTVLLPHASALAPNYMDLFVDEFVDLCRRWMAGRA